MDRHRVAVDVLDLEAFQAGEGVAPPGAVIDLRAHRLAVLAVARDGDAGRDLAVHDLVDRLGELLLEGSLVDLARLALRVGDDEIVGPRQAARVARQDSVGALAHGLASPLTAFELVGLALLGEGAGGFLEILGEVEPFGRRHVHQLAAEAVHVPAPQTHRRAHAERRVLDHLVRELARLLEILALGRHAVDQVGLECLFRREEAAGQRRLHGESAAAPEMHQAPVLARAQAARGLGDLETRALLGHDQVALQHDADRKAEHVAVRRGDHRLPVHRLGQQVGRVRAAALRAAQPQELLAAPELALLHVGAAREGAAVAAQDRDVGLVVHVEAMQRLAQDADQLVRKGVELLRPVQRQCDDRTVPRVVDERHCSLPLPRPMLAQLREGTMPTIIRMAVSAAAALTIGAGPATAQKKYDPGASDSEIKLGQTMPYSGPLSGFITLAKAELAYFAMVNDQGGVNGRKVNLISLDDGYSPPKTVEQTRRLVEVDQVLAISGSLGTPTNAAVQKYLNARKVPQLFLASGASRWNDPKNFPYTMTLTPIYTAEAAIYAAYVLKEVKDPKVAVLYQNDDFGKDFLKGFKDRLGDKAGIVVREVSYEVTDATVDSQIIDLASTKANVFLNVSSPKFAVQ